MSVGLWDGVMAEGRKTVSLKLSSEAVEAAKIAAAFKGLTLLEYASRVLLEAANRDIEEGYRSRAAGRQPSPPRRKPKEDQS
jgi:hypothetical protein